MIIYNPAPSMEQSKKIVKYISNSLHNMSSLIFNLSTELDEDVGMTQIETSEDWSKEGVCDETIILVKKEYDNILKELSESRIQINNYKIKEKEYIRMKRDYDRTVSYLLDTDKTVLKDKLVLYEHSNEDEIVKMRASEMRLKSHIKALKKDLFDSEQKSEGFKCLAMVDIENLKGEVRRLKHDLECKKLLVNDLQLKCSRLEEIVQNRSAENIELVEYCKYLV